MKRFLPFLLLFVVCFLYTLPFFRSGYFPTHDGEWAVVRMAEMMREVKDVQIPPRWSDFLNHGYGYPLFSFTYPLPYYIGVPFHVAGIGLVTTVKLVFVMSVFVSGIAMFLLARELAGESAGIIASILYIVAPFRLVDLYVRGSIGECLSFAIAPLLFYASLKYLLKPSGRLLASSSICLTLMLLAHNVTALLFFPIWLCFLYAVVISYYEDPIQYTWKHIAPMILLGIGLASFFIVPALMEKKYIALSQTKLANVSQNFIVLRDFFSSPWSYETKPTFQLGWAHIVVVIVTILSYICSGEILRKQYKIYMIFLACMIAGIIFFSNELSLRFWDIPPLSWIDFPWRLMTPLVFCIALFSSFLTSTKVATYIGYVLVGLTILLGFQFAKPSEYIQKSDSYYSTNDATTTSADELMPIWVKTKPTNKYVEKVETLEGDMNIQHIVSTSKQLTFDSVSQTGGTLSVNTVYFPGWKFYLDGMPTSIQYVNPTGRIHLTIPSGTHKIQGVFTETPIRIVSDIISMLSLIICGTVVLYPFFHKRSINENSLTDFT